MTVCGHFGPWSHRPWLFRSQDRSVHPVRSLVISVLGHFSPKDRTYLATLVLRKCRSVVLSYGGWLVWFDTADDYDGRLSAIIPAGVVWRSAGVCVRLPARHHSYRWSWQYNCQPRLPFTSVCRRHPSIVECNSSRRCIVGDLTTLPLYCWVPMLQRGSARTGYLWTRQRLNLSRWGRNGRLRKLTSSMCQSYRYQQEWLTVRITWVSLWTFILTYLRTEGQMDRDYHSKCST